MKEETEIDYGNCPKCGRKLVPTECEGLWCLNGCYKSEFDLWLALQEEKKKMRGYRAIK